MPHNILLTGVSGYLGGDLLAELASTDLPEYGKLFALIRSSEQADAVKQLGAEPLTLDVYNEDAVREAVLSHEITVVFFLINAVSSASQKLFIKALGELKKKTGSDVHFLHVWVIARKQIEGTNTDYSRPLVPRCFQAIPVRRPTVN